MNTGVPYLKKRPRRCKKFPIWQTLAAIAVGALPVAVSSQPALDLGVASKITIVPRLSVSETYTDNVFLSSTGGRSELITQISPGIRISNSGGRIRGSVDYSLTELLYARNSAGRSSQNALNANGTIEAIDNWAFIDFNGVVAQQAISAFGAPVNNGILLSGNSTETSVFRVSPYVRGRLADVADYEARYSLSSSRSGSALASDVNSKDLSARLTGVGGPRGFGWTLDANQQVVDYSAGRSTQAQRFNGEIRYPLNTALGVFVKAGHESNNFASVTDQQNNYTALGATWTPNDEARLSIDKRSDGSTGLVATWTPSRITSMSVTRERRLFGNTHSIALTYRTPNTAWTFNDSRNVVSNPSQFSGGVFLYDLLYGQFAAIETDSVKREQFDLFLRSSGITPGGIAVGGFLTSAVSLQRQQQLSFALFGARSTVTAVATRTKNTRVDTVSTAKDDVSTATAVHQNGLNVNYSLRVSPLSVFSVVAARQSSFGSSGQAGTTTRSFGVNFSTSLNKDTSVNVGARRTAFDNTTAPYNETSVTGNLVLRF